MAVLIAGPENFSAALAPMCRRGFEALGHETRLVDTHTKTIPLIGYDIGVSTLRRDFIEAASAFNPDLVFVINGDIFTSETLKRTKQETGAVLCNWNPDNPYMARSDDRRLENYLDSLNCYDIAFIWTEDLFDNLREDGATAVRHLPFAYDPNVHHPVNSTPEFESDVVFVGHWSEKRQRYLRALTDLDINLGIYGNYWKRKCFDYQLRRCVRDSAVFGEDYCRALCSAKIVINIVADHNLEAYNMKSFEIPATGSFMLTTRTEKQRELYGEGKGTVCFGSPDELRAKVTTYLDDDEGRQEIAVTGAGIVKPHTYETRMRTVIEAVRGIQ